MPFGGKTTATTKTATLTFRVEPGLKEALLTAAVREQRSIANTRGGADTRDYCGKKGITIQEAQTINNNRNYLAWSKP